MKTVIYVSGTDRVQDRRRLFGVTEYAKQHGWNLQPVEALQSPQQAKELIRIWRPDGIIVCRGAALNDLSAKSFGKTPVLFSHNPGAQKAPRENCVFSDANAVVELAAKELLSLDLAAYAFIGWFKPIWWSAQRRNAFESFLQIHGKRTTCRGGPRQAHVVSSPSPEAHHVPSAAPCATRIDLEILQRGACHRTSGRQCRLRMFQQQRPLIRSQVGPWTRPASPHPRKRGVRPKLDERNECAHQSSFS